MIDENTTIDPKTIKKGTRVCITYLPDDTVYVVNSVRRAKGSFYAASEDGRSGNWFDFPEISKIAP
jgi:hypothetical protein